MSIKNLVLWMFIEKFKNCTKKTKKDGPYNTTHRRGLTFETLKWNEYFYITPCVNCGFTHASCAEIRILTPRDIKFRTILIRKTFSWRVWLHHSPSARAGNSHPSETFHRTRIVMYYYFILCSNVYFTFWNLPPLKQFLKIVHFISGLQRYVTP